MKIEILDVAQHRNGVAAVPFDVVLFHDGESRKLAILFPERGRCAVLDEVQALQRRHHLRFQLAPGRPLRAAPAEGRQ